MGIGAGLDTTRRRFERNSTSTAPAATGRSTSTKRCAALPRTKGGKYCSVPISRGRSRSSRSRFLASFCARRRAFLSIFDPWALAGHLARSKSTQRTFEPRTRKHTCEQLASSSSPPRAPPRSSPFAPLAAALRRPAPHAASTPCGAGHSRLPSPREREGDVITSQQKKRKKAGDRELSHSVTY